MRNAGTNARNKTKNNQFKKKKIKNKRKTEETLKYTKQLTT